MPTSHTLRYGLKKIIDLQQSRDFVHLPTHASDACKRTVSDGD